MSNIFDDIWRVHGRRPSGVVVAAAAARLKRDADLRYNMEITPRRPMPARRRRSRSRPRSSARPAPAPAPRGSAPKICPTCGAMAASKTGPGLLLTSAPAPTAGGPRRGDLDPCPDCSGAGRVTEAALSVNIPAGTRTAPASGSPARAGGPARRSGGRPLHLPVAPAARVLPARQRRHLLPRRSR